MKEEVNRKMNITTTTELNDKNLLKAINMKVIPVAAYSTNICKFTQSELTVRPSHQKRFKKEQYAGATGKR